MSLANIITLARLGLVPAIIALLLGGATGVAFALFLVFLLGDLADGAIARARRETSALGEFLDPLADKLLAAGLLAAFAALGRLSWLGFALLAVPQLALLAGAVLLSRRRLRLLAAKAWGKAAATVLALGLAMIFLTITGYREVIYLGIFLSYLAGLDYLRLGLRRAKR